MAAHPEQVPTTPSPSDQACAHPTAAHPTAAHPTLTSASTGAVSVIDSIFERNKAEFAGAAEVPSCISMEPNKPPNEPPMSLQ